MLHVCAIFAYLTPNDLTGSSNINCLNGKKCSIIKIARNFDFSSCSLAVNGKYVTAIKSCSISLDREMNAESIGVLHLGILYSYTQTIERVVTTHPIGINVRDKLRNPRAKLTSWIVVRSTVENHLAHRGHKL